MSIPPTTLAEPEALRLLRAIVEGAPDKADAAFAAARNLLRGLRGGPNIEKAMGRHLSVVSPAQLREIARRAATGDGPTQIGRDLGIARGNVEHHLRPSKAMIAAMLLEAAEDRGQRTKGPR